MRHGAHVRLAGSACIRCKAKIDPVDSALYGSHVATHRSACRVVRVVPEDPVRAHELAYAFCRLVNGVGIARAARVLHAERVDPDPRVDKLLGHADVVFGRVHGGLAEAVREPHHCHADLVMHTGLDYRLSRFNEKVHVVREIEVPVPVGAVLLHVLGLKLQPLDRLCGQGHSADRSCQDLGDRIFSDGLADLVHAPERILVHIKDRRLEPRASSELEVVDARVHRGLDGWDQVVDPDLSAEGALQAVPERREHYAYLF